MTWHQVSEIFLSSLITCCKFKPFSIHSGHRYGSNLVAITSLVKPNFLWVIAVLMIPAKRRDEKRKYFTDLEIIKTFYHQKVLSQTRVKKGEEIIPWYFYTKSNSPYFDLSLCKSVCLMSWKVTLNLNHILLETMKKKTDKIVLNITGNNCESRLKNFIKINLMQNVAWN